MPSAKYAGYLGGAAVAAGVGVAIAVGGQATAHADAEDGKPAAESAGPQKPSPAAKFERTVSKVSAKVSDRVESVTTKTKFDPAGAAKDLEKKFTAKKAAQPREGAVLGSNTKNTKNTKNLEGITARVARSLNDAPVAKSDAGVQADSSGDAFFTNPFRADDPRPSQAEMFGPVTSVRDSVVSATPTELQPFVREGFEAGYRISQMVPWVNLPIPLLQIAQGVPGDHQNTQVAINQLLLTLPPVGIAYYGYDQVADLLNVEDGAAELKQDFYRTVWGIDFLGLLHNPGDSGLPPTTRE